MWTNIMTKTPLFSIILIADVFLKPRKNNFYMYRIVSYRRNMSVWSTIIVARKYLFCVHTR